MLHEVLLSLSGFPSPLFDTSSKTGAVAPDFPLLSPSETALLDSVGRLALRHRDLRAHVDRIATSHPSTVCRAVASSIRSTQLARFRRKILDVEENILKKDAKIVAAYNIVPLAGVVSEFDCWRRRMDWFWDVSVYIQTPPGFTDASEASCCSGAALIDKLRREVQTGYSDIEEVAIELGEVAEAAWLRLLASWTLYGRIPTIGAADFFIQRANNEERPEFELQPRLMPSFVTADTAASIFFIGQSLNQIRSRDVAAERASVLQADPERVLLSRHLQYLHEIKTPATAASLATAIGSIRDSLSQNTLQRLLPLPKVRQTVSVLYEFFLLGRRDFTAILIHQADARLESRGHTRSSSKALPGSEGNEGVRGLLFKESELSSILESSFSNLAMISSLNDDQADFGNTMLDQARAGIRLKLDRQKQGSFTGTAFNDLLLPMPTSLTLTVGWPLDLFISAAELGTYSRINSYLISIERAHIHLTDLWKLTSLRRDHPCPPGPPLSSTERGRKTLAARRNRRTKRDHKMRKVWATVGKAVFFFSELIVHFNGSIINSAWSELWRLMDGRDRARPSSAGDLASSASINSPIRSNTQIDEIEVRSPDTTDAQSHSRLGIVATDPAVRSQDLSALAALHQAYLDTVSEALLLSESEFSKELRQLLLQVENLVAQVKRLQTVQTNLDLEEDDGVVDGLNDWAAEEKSIDLELDRARKKVDEGLRACVDVLGRLDVGTQKVMLPADGNGTVPGRARLREESGWKWKAPGVDHLLMKLEFGRIESLTSEDEDVP